MSNDHETAYRVMNVIAQTSHSKYLYIAMPIKICRRACVLSACVSQYIFGRMWLSDPFDVSRFSARSKIPFFNLLQEIVCSQALDGNV